MIICKMSKNKVLFGGMQLGLRKKTDN